MLTIQRKLKKTILLLGDLAIFEISLVLTLFLRYGRLQESDLHTHLAPFTVLFGLWMVGFYVVGLYDLQSSPQRLPLLRRVMEGMIANLALGIAYFYLVPFFGIEPRTNLFLLSALALVLVYGWHLLFTRVIAPRFSPNAALFIGASTELPAVESLLAQSTLGTCLSAMILTDAQEERVLATNQQTSYAFHQLETVLESQSIQMVILGAKPQESSKLEPYLYRTLFHRVQLIDRAELEELTTGRIPLDYVNETWFLHHLREGDKAWYETLKRGLDLALAIPFGLLLLALLPFVFVLMKASMPGPIFYTQLRVGKNGDLFRIWKFRSMIVNSETQGAQFTASAKTDPRLTSLGRFLRQTRIDELPQIWNVLRGDLSFIGPRPERPEFVAPLVERMPYYALRHIIRPGLTGWAQVHYLKPNASLEDNLPKLQYDLYYVKHRSFLMDLSILLKTIGIVLRRQGT